MQTPQIHINESRTFIFPVFDFNGVASGAALSAGSQIPLQLGSEGYWAVYGLSATMCTTADVTGLINGSNINIQILDIQKEKYFFAMGNNFALNGVPIEAVAGKYGNPSYFNYPRILAPGSRLLLYASQTSGFTPTTRSPLYVAVHCVLMDKPVENMTMPSQAYDVKNHEGEPFSFNTKFGFSNNNLLVNLSRLVSSPLNAKTTFYIDSVTARSSLLTTAFINTIDPRQQEPEILLTMRDSIAQSNYGQPDPVPLALMAGIAGCRAFVPPTCFVVNPGANLIASILNNTGSTITSDIDLTFQGTIIEAQS